MSGNSEKNQAPAVIQSPHNPICNTPEGPAGVPFLTEIVPEILEFES